MNPKLRSQDKELSILKNHFIILRRSKDRSKILYTLEALHDKVRGNDELKVLVCRQGVSEILLKYMQSEVPELKLAAAKVFRSISVNERGRSIMSDENVAKKLIKVLAAADNVALQIICLSSLWNLALNEINRKEIMAEGGVQLLAQMLEVGDARMLNEVLGALRVISEDDEGKAFIGDSGAIRSLVKLLHSSIEKVQGTSALILKNICIEDKKNMHLLDAEGGSGKLLQILSKHGTEFRTKSALPRDVLSKYFDELISWEDLVFIKELGEGRYGHVYMAKYCNFLVACKVIKNPLTVESAESQLEELRLMRRLKHPNVLLLLGVCLNPSNQVVIVTEFLARGNLKSCIGDIKNLSVRMSIVMDIARGLNWLHAHQVVHRDLKLANLLVDKDYTVKISDFGLSLDLRRNQVCHDFRGNLKYSPPEILRARYDKSMPVYQYTEKTDVYSFGLIFWEMISYKQLFANMQGKDEFTNMVLMGERPRLLHHWPESVKDLLTCCWNESASRRPLFPQILKRLEVIYIDLMCPDPLGKRVCKQLWKFRRHSIIPFREFEQVLQELVKPDPKYYAKNIKYLWALLCDPYDDTVKFDRFCQVLSWFGPFQPFNAFLKRIRHTLRLPSFHGDLSVQKATFLIRECYYRHHHKPDTKSVPSTASPNISTSSANNPPNKNAHRQASVDHIAPGSVNPFSTSNHISRRKSVPKSRTSSTIQNQTISTSKQQTLSKHISHFHNSSAQLRSHSPSSDTSMSSSNLLYDTHCAFFYPSNQPPSITHYYSTFFPASISSRSSSKLLTSTNRLSFGSHTSYFLYRFSAIDFGAFVLTYVDKDGYIFHKKIQHESGKYFIDDFSVDFPDFLSLHKFCKRRFKLQRHVPGSIYQTLFA